MYKKFPSKLIVAVIATIIAVCGFYLLSGSQAATESVWAEAESGAFSNGASSVNDTSASGGRAARFTTTFKGPLPFDMPSQASLKSSPKKVYAHYFTPYPISLHNEPTDQDYYAVHYNSPTGENSKFLPYGGFFRQRPLPRPVSTSPNWEIDDMKTEVRRATAAGIDGFAVDVLGLSGANWNRLNYLLQAAQQVDPAFKIMLMPDTNSIIDSGNTVVEYAAAMAGLAAKYPSTVAKLPDGRLIISPFAPENKGAAWWQSFITTMKNTHGITVAFVPCFVYFDVNRAADTRFSSFFAMSYGLSSWGGRSPASNSTTTAVDTVNYVHDTLNKIWMAPVAVQDIRPSQRIYDEANNSELLRKTWNNAITANADWVQVPTWNDYSEGTELSPSNHTGWSPLDISSYYIARYKSATGSWPAIVRDVIYVSHRKQRATAAVTQQTAPMTLRSGSSPARDKVEVLAFLTSNANVTFKINDASTTSAAVKSIDGTAAILYDIAPAAANTISASVSRSGGSATTTVTSPFSITTGSVGIQDLQYHFVSSGR